MNLEKVVFGFFIILAMTLNFGFVFGDVADPNHHHVYELFAAIVVNLIATVLKFGERTQIGAIRLAASFVADLPLTAGDRILLCGTRGAWRQQNLAQRNINVLTYLLTGRDAPQGWAWNRLGARKGRAAAP